MVEGLSETVRDVSKVAGELQDQTQSTVKSFEASQGIL